jgi:hypothetical protein
MKKLFVFFAAVALVCAAVPAMAADWSFFGSARMATFWVSDDYGSSENDVLLDNGQTINSDQDLQWDFAGSSRIGAKVKVPDTGVDGYFELGLKGDGAGDVAVGTRRMFGRWYFTNNGYLKVGKDYTPITRFISGQVFDADLDLLGIGSMYGARMGQVTVGFGGFEVAFITPDTPDIDNLSSTLGATATGGNTNRYLPKIEAKYEMTMDAFDWGIRGGFQWYQISDVVPIGGGSSKDLDIYSYIIGADAGFNFGPAYVKGQVSYGQNVGNANWNLPGENYGHGNESAVTGTNTSDLMTGFAYWNGNSTVKNTNTTMAALVAGFKMTDMLTFEAGGGWRRDSFDLSGLDDTDVYAVYGQAVIGMAPGVWLVPEVGYFKYGDDVLGNDAGSRWYAGAKWQIDF